MSSWSSRPGLTVMTLNVGNGLAPPERLAAYLRNSGADVIGLQEVSQDQGAALARDMTAAFPFQVVRGTGFSGRALLSRRPILAHTWLEFVPERPDLQVTLDVAGRALAVIVAHPYPPRLSRRGMIFDNVTATQIDRLAPRTVEAAPAVLLGDLNLTCRHPAYARFVAAGLADAFATSGTGRGWTLPKRLGHSARFNHGLHGFPLVPVIRVDYIWHTRGLSSEAAWVGGDAGSDHLPVLARLSLTKP